MSNFGELKKKGLVKPRFSFTMMGEKNNIVIRCIIFLCMYVIRGSLGPFRVFGVSIRNLLKKLRPPLWTILISICKVP